MFGMFTFTLHYIIFAFVVESSWIKSIERNCRDPYFFIDGWNQLSKPSLFYQDRDRIGAQRPLLKMTK